MRKAETLTIETALKRGLAPRVELFDAADAPRYLDMGVKHFCIGWDVTILRRRGRRTGPAMREQLGLPAVAAGMGMRMKYGRNY